MNQLLFIAFLSAIIFIGNTDNIENRNSDYRLLSGYDTIKGVISTNLIYKTTAFNAGDDGINSYRIPSLVTSKKGSLLLFCEARKISSTDKTPTDIAFKRSTDNGKTWSEIKIIAEAGNNAFMDPCALVDKVSGKIFLFTTLWPAGDHSTLSNTAWIVTSEDDGLTWSKPYNITKEIVAPGNYIAGFGPGSGLQMTGTKYENRLIIPTRQTDGKKSKDRAVYSDDHGKTWQVGAPAPDGGEYQIAESPKNTLIYNLRGPKGKRIVARSHDGGLSWGDSHIDFQLQSPVDYGGCQASVLGIDSLLYYAGPAGGLGSDSTEDRQFFKIYRSWNGGEKCTNNYLLFNKAAGYSCITQLSDRGLAIVFETSDNNGFLKMTPGNRPPGWMRLDVIVLPKEVTWRGYWFQEKIGSELHER